MKKILAYLLVLVSLMTLFCGTASAETTFSQGGSAGIHVPILVTDLKDGSVEPKPTCVATLHVVATCKYEGNTTLYPVAAWSILAYPTVSAAGGTAVRRGEPTESTKTFYEGGKRSIVEHYYTATIEATYAARGSKGVDDEGKTVYIYGSKTETIVKSLQTKICFYRR